MPPPYTMQAISAPYNFVPLAGWVHIPDWSQQASHDWPFEDGLSGEIRYRLVADSPLLVGGHQRQASDRSPGEVRPFQLPEGRYAIPGSSLKGMLRAVVEIAGFGRMRMVDDRHLSVRDLTSGAREIYGKMMTHLKGSNTYEATSKAGWLRFDPARKAWIMRPCSYARVEHDDLAGYSGDAWWRRVPRTSAKDKYTKWDPRPLDLAFDPGAPMAHTHSGGKKLFYGKASNLGRGKATGTLVFTGQPSKRDPGKNGRKHLEFIFYAPTSTILEVAEDVWRDFVGIHAESEEWRFWKSKAKIPVFYMTDGRGDVASIGLALMYRLAYTRSIHEAIANSSADHCASPGATNGYDLADLLFGAVDGEQPQSDALRGRVSCETALAERTDLQPEQQEDTILNGPKPSYYPNYILQITTPDTDKLKDQKGGYRTFMDCHVRLRGFKRYPARPESMTHVQPLTAEQTGNNRVKVRLHALPKGTAFNGRIVFHNLRPAELGALLWAMTWGGKPTLRHGLGMGKPFGFGQVSLEVNSAASLLIHNDGRSSDRGLEEARVDEFVNAFRTHMERAAEGRGGWEGSAQIKNLLAMADRNAAKQLQRLRPDMKLCHMRLDGNNEFVNAKREGLVLASFAVATGRDVSPASQPSGGGPTGPTARHPWLVEQIQRIKKQHRIPNDADVWGGKPLAEAWKVIDDAVVKGPVLEEIKAYWQARGWWESPPKGAKRKAKEIYVP